MQDYLDILQKSALFSNVNRQDLEKMLSCLLAKIKTYEKNTYIVKASHTFLEVGIVLSGRVNIVKEDYWGNRSILTTLKEGELFGEAFACAQTQYNIFSVVAVEKAKIMFINYEKITSPCQFVCKFHTQIIQNMLQLMAQKNIMLTTKIEHLTQKNTRAKLLSYLSTEAIKQHNHTIIIPFNRQELADFLSVERSAMSAELSRMRKDGLIDYTKNKFILYNSLIKKQ